MPLRVMHVLPHRGGGGETYVDMLERLDGFTHERFYLSSSRKAAGGLTSIPVRWPALASRARRADILHSHGDVASVIALPLIRMRPTVMTCQGLHMLRRVHGVRRRAMTSSLAAVIRAARAVICSSQAERDELAALVPPREHHTLYLVYNGIDPRAPASEAERKSVRAELGLDEGAVLGLFAGQLEERKRPLLAARAAIEARQAGAQFVLAVAGEGPQAEALQRLAGEAVLPLGFRADVPRLLGAADVFIQASEREGMSFALLEAMAHGLAVVAADGSSNPEAIGDAGLLFRAGDEKALAAAIVRLSADVEERTSLGERARERSREEFSPEAFLDASASIYRLALEDASR
jgi:glycosyltransferase involved in cell wall biosynthesis